MMSEGIVLEEYNIGKCDFCHLIRLSFWGRLYVTRMKLYNLNFWMVFSILLVRYMNKMATDGGGGVVAGSHSDDCKRNIGPGLKSPPVSFLYRKKCLY